jgi:hypothetical protein
VNAAEAGEQIGGVLPSPEGETGGAVRQSAPPPLEVVVVKRVGHTDTGDVCGFSDTEDGPPCGAPPARHGLFLGTWEGASTGYACKWHASALILVADYSHEADGSHVCFWDDPA